MDVVTYTRHYAINLLLSSSEVTGFVLILSSYGTIQTEKDHVEFGRPVPERKFIMKRFYSTQYNDVM
jgi:hypothetical protein